MSTKKNNILPLIIMKGLVVFPDMVLNFDVGNPKSIEALKTASLTDRRIFLATQSNPDAAHPTINDVYPVGIIAEVKQILKTPDKITRVLVQGISRARVVSISEFERYDVAEISPIAERNYKISESTANAAFCSSNPSATLLPAMHLSITEVNSSPDVLHKGLLQILSRSVPS